MSEGKDSIYQYQPLWGKWYIDLPVGKGSFGTVYKVTREEMGSKYTSAVKLITVPSEEQYKEARASLGNDEDTLSGFFEDIVKNIINEINALYSLAGNPNIINYQDHEMIKKKDAAEWDILIRMEYVTSLSKYLEENRLTREQVIRLGTDICTALEACSKKGIVHRDIKDENIFINEDGVFKLGDFGIARELSKSGRAASMRGTPLYMAPEVFKGEKYDAAVDIYSLGILLYKLLNYGRMPLMPPYPQPVSFKDSESALERRVSGEPLPVPALAGDKLGPAVLKACAYRPENRYASAAEMKRAFEQVLSALSTAQRTEIVTPEKGKRAAAQKTDTQQQYENKTQYTETVGIFEPAGAPSYTTGETDQTFENPEIEQTVGIFGTADPRQTAGKEYQESTKENQDNERYEPDTAYSYRQPENNRKQDENKNYYSSAFGKLFFIKPKLFNAKVILCGLFLITGFIGTMNIILLLLGLVVLTGVFISKYKQLEGDIIILSSISTLGIIAIIFFRSIFNQIIFTQISFCLCTALFVITIVSIVKYAKDRRLSYQFHKDK